MVSIPPVPDELYSKSRGWNYAYEQSGWTNSGPFDTLNCAIDELARRPGQIIQVLLRYRHSNSRFYYKTVDPIRSQRIQTSPIPIFFKFWQYIRIRSIYQFSSSRPTGLFDIHTKWPGNNTHTQFTTPANAVNRPRLAEAEDSCAIRWQVLRETRLIYATIDDIKIDANLTANVALARDHNVSYPHLANYNNVCK